MFEGENETVIQLVFYSLFYGWLIGSFLFLEIKHGYLNLARRIYMYVL